MNKRQLKCTLFFIAPIFFCVNSIAQPVILDGNNLPSIGQKDTSANSTSSAVSPGPAGANVTWNLSAVAATKNTVYEWVTPASTPFGSSYPSANKAIKGTYFGSGSFYHYRRLSATNWEHIAQGVVAAGAIDYTANPKTIFPIPFNYLDVYIDTFVITGSPASTQTITYDGYGTLTTPYGTMGNVIRVKADNGSSISYTWFTTSPVLKEIASYYSSSQQYYFTGTNPVTGTTGLDKTYQCVQIIPNPVTNYSSIRITSDIKDGRFILTDISGKMVRELNISNGKAILNRDGISAGLYTYAILNNGKIIARGRLTIQ